MDSPNTTTNDFEKTDLLVRSRGQKDDQPTKIQLGDTNEFVQLLNGFNATCQELIKDTIPDATEREQKMVKQLFLGLTKTLASNMCLPNEEPIPVETVLTEPEDDTLNKESEQWRLNARDMQQRVTQSRSDFIDHIRPWLTESTTAAYTHFVQGSFDDDNASETDDTHIDPLVSQQIKREFEDSMALLSTVRKELPQRHAAYDHIDTIEAERNKK